MESGAAGLSFAEKRQRGCVGEEHVAGILRSRGWYVVPSYDYTGTDGNKAPKLQGEKGCYVVPDLDAAKGGRRIWIEVKVKKSASLYKKTNTLEHGIPLHHWRDYRSVQKITGSFVWVVICEEESGELLYASLDSLEGKGREYAGHKMGGSGMIFWPRAAFKLFACGKGEGS